MDAHLIEQAFGALLSNAAAHGMTDQPIEVSVARDDSMLVFSVADHGPGLAPGEENKVFEKFYRGPGTPAGRARPWSFDRAPIGRSARRPDRGAKSRTRRLAFFHSASRSVNRCSFRRKRPHETGRIDCR